MPRNRSYCVALYMKGRELNCVSAFALVCLISAVCFLEPGTTRLLPSCPFRAITGLYCPGCGTTRMLYFLVHGQLVISFAQNPLAMLLLPWVSSNIVQQLVRPKRPVWPRLSNRMNDFILAVILLFALLRNIPYLPFIYLSPQNTAQLNSESGHRTNSR